MDCAAKGRALFHTRDSGGRAETTPVQYVQWACMKAQELGLLFDGSGEKISEMIRNGESSRGDLYLDYDVCGNKLSRPGLNGLLDRISIDSSVSHVLIPRRDRLARPDEAVDAVKLEQSIRRQGVTLVFMSESLPPLKRGQRSDIAHSIMACVEYDRAGRDRTDLAQKIIYSQLELAKAGYSIGGRPPYAFRRWLVKNDGTTVRELQESERVRMRGHHVVWLPVPEDHPDMVNMRRILTMLRTMPASRVAATLTAEGVKSPDAGRLRKDYGVLHPVSGVWHQSTIMNIARNPLLLAICSSGRRSMGDQLRHSATGSRPLKDSDYRADGKPKVVRNPETDLVTAPARFAPLVDPDQHQRLLADLDERGGTQRGKARSHDPSRNPLGGRVYDMNCGWLMYRTPYGASFRYSCGAYMQSHGQRCSHNHVDGPTAAGFLLCCLGQKMLTGGMIGKLKSRLRELAEEEHGRQPCDQELNFKTAALERVERDLATAKQNMARANSDEHYRAVAEVFDDLKRQHSALSVAIAALATKASAAGAIETEVEAAWAAIDRLPDLVVDQADLTALGEAFRTVNAKLFLRFQPVRAKKRTLNVLAGGVVTFGATSSPVRLYEGPTGRRTITKAMAARNAAQPGGDVTLLDDPGSGREVNSLGNVNRGDRI